MLDRNEVIRSDTEFISSARRAPETRFVVYSGPRALLKPALPITPKDMDGQQLASLGLDPAEAVFLGLSGQTPWFAVDIASASDEIQTSCAADGRFETLAAIQDPIAGDAWSVLAQARALLAWNAAAKYCSCCGALTEMLSAGYQRSCTDTSCGALHFPRTDPAVIVRVTNGDRCLLARQPSFPPGLQSVLAGFAEPGETLEETVVREIKEEVGLRVGDPVYIASQAWPFPTSMMIAFSVEAAEETIRIDGREIEAADWYTREEIRQRMSDGSLVLPSVKSIARRLIDDWLDNL
jgi:NAD+ diphosphatase